MKNLLLLVLITTTYTVFAQSDMPRILSMQERAKLQNVLLEERIQTVLPMLMRRAGVDMWILIAREYNEDPVIKTMLPATWLSARRRTILVMYDQGGDKGVECLAVARYDVGSVFKKAWDKEQEPDQWKRLMDIIEERQPSKIGINKSTEFALADGITATEYKLFMEKLPAAYQDKVVGAKNLAIGWLETRTEREMVVYKQIMRIAHQIIAEGFSQKVITPGFTTTDDVVWWYRDRIRELGLTAWFHPTVAIQRNAPESSEHLRNFSKRPDQMTIMPGDLLHVDFGITYLRLNTDTQQHAYVLKPDEQDAPDYLRSAFKTGNRLQDILTNAFETGRSGNDILAAALQQAESEDIKATIYTHPIGYHGHGAGPTIGLWDQQDGVPGKGDYPMYENTAYSIELNATVNIPEWGKEIRIMLEEDAFFDGETTRYIDGRQTELLLIPRKIERVE